VSVQVEARDAVWSMDATHLGRDASGGEVQAEVVREVASTCTIGIAVGPPATGEDIVRLLDDTARVRGTKPLVLLTDNGTYRSGAVAAWCDEHDVLHLFSLPRTPQHNPGSEHGMRELKEESALGKGTPVLDTELVRAQLEATRDRLDGARLRRTRGWCTARQADRRAPPWWSLVSRKNLRAAATCAIREALLHYPHGRARRTAVREAILGTLQRFTVITRTRGGRPWEAQLAEDVS
jgi:hypothetical protein